MNKKVIKIDMYEILQKIENEALEYKGSSFGYYERIVARLWNDGDITLDYYDGNCHPCNTDDYIEIAESTPFHDIYETICNDLSLAKDDYLSEEYLDYLESEKNEKLIKEFEELDDIDFKIEFIEEHSPNWYDEWIEETKQSIIDFYDFWERMDERYGEDFDRELREFEKRHDLTIEIF